ncbi:MAG: S1 family peptidase, partial [Bradyrhizobiaceae bacterium]|nr:S1 family peptidase [Bradyrhizobiaceae bacterium]
MRFLCFARSAALACSNLLAVLALVLAWAKRAAAIVGGAANADPSVAQHVALIVGSQGTSCTGVVIARNLVL